MKRDKKKQDKKLKEKKENRILGKGKNSPKKVTKKKVDKNPPSTCKGNTSKVSCGNTLQTRDEFFAGQKNKNVKENHPLKNDLYRSAVIIRVNKNDEYAVVPLTTKKKIKLDDYYDKKTYAKDFIEIFDCDGNAITQNEKFVINKDKKKIVSKKDLKKIEKQCLELSKRKQHNQKQIKRFESRMPKK